MGLFGDVGKFLTKTVAPAIATGGLSLIPVVRDVVKPVSNIASGIAGLQLDPTPLLSATNNFGASFTRGGQPAYSQADLARLRTTIGTEPIITPPPQPIGDPMALNLGGILSTVGNIFGGGQNPVFDAISTGAQFAQQFVPTSTALAVRPPQATPAPMVPRMVAPVARGFFNKFPNLAAGIAQLRARGFNVKRSQLWNLLKRFGPELLVTGGLLTAAAISELMVAGPGRRRMNPANVKALRRSMRRLDSFHRLCVQTDRLRRPKARACKTSSRGAGTQFVRQG